MGTAIRQAYLKPSPAQLPRPQYLILFNSPNTECSVPLYYVPNTICIAEYTRVDIKRQAPCPQKQEKIHNFSYVKCYKESRHQRKDWSALNSPRATRGKEHHLRS